MNQLILLKLVDIFSWILKFEKIKKKHQQLSGITQKQIVWTYINDTFIKKTHTTIITTKFILIVHSNLS